MQLCTLAAQSGPAYLDAFTLDTCVTANEVKFTYYVADHCELVWSKLDLARVVQEPDVDEETMPEPPVSTAPLPDGGRPDPPRRAQAGADAEARSAKRRRVATLADTGARLCKTMASLTSQSLQMVENATAADWRSMFAADDTALTSALVQDMMHALLRQQHAWVWYSEKAVRAACLKVADLHKKKDHAAFAALAAAACLTLLAVGKLVQSERTEAGGKPVWYFLKRPLAAESGREDSHCRNDLQALEPVLLKLKIHEESEFSLAAYVATTTRLAKQPARAPAVAWLPTSTLAVSCSAQALGLMDSVEPELPPTQVVPSQPAPAPSAPLALNATFEAVTLPEACKLRVVPVPWEETSLFMCVALHKASGEDVMAWNCAVRNGSNHNLDEDDREGEAEIGLAVAQNTLPHWKPGAAPWSVEDFEKVGLALNAPVLLYSCHGPELCRARFYAAGARPSLKLLMTLSADCALHFDFLREGILEDEATDQHGGWGM